MAVEDPGHTSAPALRIARVADRRGPGRRGRDVVDELPSDARLVFVSPSHQFPLGTAMSLRRRRRCHGPRITTPRSSKMTTTPSSGSAVGRSSRCSCLIAPGGLSTWARSRSRCYPRCGLAPGRPAVHPPRDRGGQVRGRLAYPPCQHSEPSLRSSPTALRSPCPTHAGRVPRAPRPDRDRLRRDLSDELEVLPASAGVHVSALARTRSVDEMASVASEPATPASRFSSWRISRSATSSARVCCLVGAIATEHIDEGLRRLIASFDGDRRPPADVARRRR